MTISPPDLTSLDADAVVAALTEVSTRLQEDNPALDLRRGPFAEQLAYYHAVLGVRLQTQVDEYLQARSLYDIEQDPALADTETVDAVLSNFGVTRIEGATALGDVIFVVSDNSTVVIASGAEFTCNGLTFLAIQAFIAKAEEEQVINSGDRLLRERGDGSYEFTITVQAVETGTAANLRKDTLIVPTVPPSTYITSYVASDFSDGVTAETNDALLLRLQQGIAAKGADNRGTSAALLRQHADFSGFVQLSIVGYGDAEMVRDQHGLIPISGGGRVDWYVRMHERLYHQSLTVTATLISKTDDNRGTWQFSLNRGIAPGFYEIANIRLPDSDVAVGGFTIVSDTRALDFADDTFVPDVINMLEGAYSRYQTAVIQFEDTDTNTTEMVVGDTQEYSVEARMVRQLDEVQDYLLDYASRSWRADILVRAPIPCFVEVSFAIEKTSHEPTPDLDGIKAAIAAIINNVAFTGRLYGSQLADAAKGFLHNATSVTRMDMFGRIREPDGTMTYIRDGDVLVVPDYPERMISAKTVQFFTDPDDIAITILTTIPTAL